MRAAGLLLTGGASRRLGTPKAVLRLAGETLADRSARTLAGACDPVLEVGPGYSGLTAVREDPAGEGPLAAVAAGGAALASARHGGMFVVLAVDLPLVSEALLVWLANQAGEGTVVPRVRGIAQTLCARYGADAPAVARGLVHDGQRSMRSLLDALTVVYADEGDWGTVAEEHAFDDVDTRADAERAGLELP